MYLKCGNGLVNKDGIPERVDRKRRSGSDLVDEVASSLVRKWFYNDMFATSCLSELTCIQ